MDYRTALEAELILKVGAVLWPNLSKREQFELAREFVSKHSKIQVALDRQSMA